MERALPDFWARSFFHREDQLCGERGVGQPEVTGQSGPLLAMSESAANVTLFFVRHCEQNRYPDTLRLAGAEDKPLGGRRAERRLRGQDQAGTPCESQRKIIKLGLALMRTIPGV